MRWSCSQDGTFTIKSAYRMLDAQNELPREPRAWIWKMRCPQKYKYFIWLVVQNKLLTNQLRYKRCLTDSNHCRRCMAPYEDCLHILRDYHIDKEIWLSSLNQVSGKNFFDLGLMD
ncbi:zf-RVT domain-containing protein [Cephalotus follicularis]|uniref:Zf-RVT domain-containing protein n=1 Tax=Cephalotus follicularis TaxID=3775 RepID=A0A1Q3B182_CEPFO|nr:zf-RVT domain-containing protein [Cephalotus follicularis]